MNFKEYLNEKKKYNVRSSLPIIKSLAHILEAGLETKGRYISPPDPGAIGESYRLTFEDAVIQLSTRLIDDRLEITGISSKDISDLGKVKLGSGKGTLVIKTLIKICKQKKLTLVVIDSTKSAKPYYDKQPFLKRHEVITIFDSEEYIPPISYIGV